MHFSIPDTSEAGDKNGSTHTVFNVHINGVYHCSVRYREFHSFHEQLKKEFPQITLPVFPPKKLLSLSAVQLNERRAQLERYIQCLSQIQCIGSGNSFNSFLLEAQQRSQKEKPENVSLNIYLMNGHTISVDITSTDKTERVLEKTAAQIQLPSDLTNYFALFLVKKEEGADNAIVRKLQDFESPFISLKAACKSVPYRIVVRKCFWDSEVENEIIDDRIVMNLLYVQAVSDVSRGWVLASKEQRDQLKALQDKNSKRQYLDFARGLRYYGFIQFHPCICDYPEKNTRIVVHAGNRELVFTLRSGKGGVTEHMFKVTRMRCWRITSSYADTLDETSTNQYSTSQGEHPSILSVPIRLELSFEYLVSKDNLKWITICSEQAILMSMCLQGMVDELIMKKQGLSHRKSANKQEKTVANGTSQSAAPSQNTQQTTKKVTSILPRSPFRSADTNPMFKRSISSASQGLPGSSTENDVFERDDGIGDDDL